MRVRVVLLSILVAAMVAACGVIDDGKVESINPPAGLSDTLPTTTLASTTTELSTTTSPLETTTVPAVQTEQVRLYFIASGQLTYVTAQLPSPVALPQILAALQAGPPAGELGTGLRTAMPRTDEVPPVTTDGSGVAQVVLPDGFFDAIAPGDKRLVIAQVVLTLTDSRGIGQVVFNQAVPTPSGELYPAGQPLAYRDYQSLLGASSITSATTVVPGTTTTSPSG